MEKLTIKELAPYLAYGLKVVYEGITNTKELSEWRKKEPKDIFDDGYMSWVNSEPEHKIGLKVSELKGIKMLKHGYLFRVGRSFDYGKNAFLDDIKPLLRPLSDLTKEIEVNGEKFVPINILDKNSNLEILDCINDKDFDFPQDVDLFPYWVVCSLIEWNFDVFGLIDKGLAVDLNNYKS